MNQYQEPQIILKFYDLYKTFYLEIKKWPKPERYNLGRKCEEIILEILENLLTASRLQTKHSNLFRANIKLQMLKKLIRLGKDIQVINNKKYIFLEKELFEIGRMLGGWLKSI